MNDYLIRYFYFTVYINDLQVEPNFKSMIGNIHRHGINTVVVLIDVAILSYPIRLLHVSYTFVFGFLYSTVTFIYWLKNKKDNIIYETLEYNKPMLVLMFFSILTALVILLQVN